MDIQVQSKHMLPPELLICGRNPLIQNASNAVSVIRKHTLNVKTCIKIIDVLSYSDLQAMNTGGKKHLTLYALGYRLINHNDLLILLT
jgi:predicted transcriptional regulator